MAASDPEEATFTLAATHKQCTPDGTSIRFRFAVTWMF